MAHGPSHLVVCPEQLAAKAGEEIFALGGNAADAAIATAFAQTVVDPFMCSLGGTSMALVWNARRRELFTLSGAATVGSVPPPDYWIDEFQGRLETVGRVVLTSEENQVGYRSIMVPGFVRGAQELFERLGSGKVAWSDLLAPAIRLAEEGYTLTPYVAKAWDLPDDPGHRTGRPGNPSFDTKISATPDTTAIFMKNGTDPYNAGDHFVMCDLAKTLRTLAEEGPESFYSGSIGAIIVEDFRQHGALISEDDLRNYQVKIRQPLATDYRGYRVHTNPPPTPGVPIMTMLNIVEGWDPDALGWGSGEYTHRLSAAMRSAFRDYAVHGDDPDYVEVPVDLLTSKERAAAWRAAIEEGRGDVAPDALTGIPDGTTHVTTTDDEGNIVLWTHSIGSLAGSGVVTSGLGFLYNNFLGFFDPRPGTPRELVPGKRVAGGGSCVVFKDDQPVLALGSPGGSRLVSSVFQVIVNVLDHGMPAQEAVSVPRFHSEEPGKIFIEPAVSDKTHADLEQRGYDVARSTYMARVQAIHRDPESGAISAGADPRGEGGVGQWPREG